MSVTPHVPAVFNLADFWEAAADRCAEREAVVCGDTRLTYAQLEDRVNALAHWFLARGIEPGQHIGVYLENGIEYIEVLLAAYKVRAVPINVNYRYVEAELRHLFVDADLVGVVCQPDFASHVEAVRSDCPDLAWVLVTGDAYESALGAVGSHRPVVERSSDDAYVIYTGGTTGLPKGVVWRHEDAFYACIGGGDPMRLSGAVERPEEMPDRILDGSFRYLPVAPLMHAAGQWTVLMWLFAGGTVVLLPGSLDPQVVWQTAQDEQINLLTVVGDAVVRPLVDEWDRSGPYDVSSLFSVGSGGAPLTPALRERLATILPNVVIADGFGSSETGAQGAQRTTGVEQASGGATRFSPYGDTTVLDEETLEPVEPGSGAIGRVALRGHIPQGYYKDPERTAQTFVEVGGHRWVITGDHATVEEDGTIRLLGRGSGCINTGGEKVFPEEVEAALKRHPGVYDALVVGVPDDRWGSRVVAVVQPSGDPATFDTEGLLGAVRGELAGYKVPKQVVLVDRVVRSPAGKPDYRWATSVAESGGG
jgi:acyl-CoA synthetase (AMP-forming)/AMP-acid ligase II